MRTLALALSLGLIAIPAFANDAPSGVDEVIEFRKSVMNTAGHSARLLMHMSKGTLQHEQHFPAIASQMAAGAALMKDAFRQNTIGQSTKEKTQVASNDAIWTNWEDFASRADAFAADTATTASLANAGDIDGAKASLKAVFSHCKSCHEKYED